MKFLLLGWHHLREERDLASLREHYVLLVRRLDRHIIVFEAASVDGYARIYIYIAVLTFDYCVSNPLLSRL